MRRISILTIVSLFLVARAMADEKPPGVPPELAAQAVEARKQLAQGDSAAAERTYRKLLEAAPDNVYVLTNLGAVLIGQLGKAQLAGEMLDKARRLAGNDLLLGEDFYDAEFNRAVVFAFETPPDKLRARQHYDLAVRLGAERDSALEALIKETDVGSPGVPPTPAGSSSEPNVVRDVQTSGQGSAKTATVASPNVPPELLPLAREGKEQFEQGNYAAAEVAYRKLLAKAPNNLYALSNLGVVLFRAAKLREAEAAFKRAIALAPDDGFSHCTLGIDYLRYGRTDDAINELTKALAIDSRNAKAHAYLSVAAERKGWSEAAQKERETAIALDASFRHWQPDEAADSKKPAGIRYGNATVEEITKHNEEALAAATEALTRNPNDARAHCDLGVIQCQMGHTGKAIQEFKTAIALDPKYAGAHFNLAVAFATMTPPDKVNAGQSYRRAVELGEERDEALEKFLQGPGENAGAAKSR